MIIIPTYNEQENITATILALETVFQSVDQYEMSILVFDSASTDDTQRIVRHLQEKYANIFLLTEDRKSGLGSAYIQAMEHAMNVLSADIVVEFDADGSHQPKHIPGMLALLSKNSDCVVGSRYIKHGSIPTDWAIHRKFLSICGNLIARFFLTPKYKDFTSGFRATRASILRKINLPGLLSKNYAYKLHLFWAIHKAGAKIREFPIEFIDREKGNSKFPKNNMLESLKVVIVLRIIDSQQVLKVIAVGVFGIIVQLIAFNFLRFKLNLWLANLISIEIAIISNFILNNIFSFSDRKFEFSHGLSFILKKFLTFNGLSLGSLVIQILTINLGVHFFGRGFFVENFLVLVGIIAGFLVNYIGYQKIIWKKDS